MSPESLEIYTYRLDGSDRPPPRRGGHRSPLPRFVEAVCPACSRVSRAIREITQLPIA